MKKILGTILVFILFVAGLYFLNNYITQKQVQACSYAKGIDKESECYKVLFNSLLPKMLIHKAKFYDSEVKLARLESNQKVHPLIALHLADAIIGYGVCYDIEFENMASFITNKDSYAFDCGSDINNLSISSPKCHFYPECIGTDKYVLFWQKSSKQIHTFEQKLKELNLENKKIYLKMDIAGAETEVLPDILKNYSNQLTGISINFHIDKISDFKEIDKIIDLLNKDFVLISRNTITEEENHVDVHSFWYNGILQDRCIVLGYINKNIIDSYEISLDQNTENLYKNIQEFDYSNKNNNPIPENDINILITLTEKLKTKVIKIFKKNNDTFDELLPQLLIYKAKVNNKPLELVKVDSTSRLNSLYALEKSDALIGYDIYRDIFLEDNYSVFFDKPSYAFDCGSDTNNLSLSPKCHFYSECINTDKYIPQEHVSSKKIHSFSQKLKELNLENKKIYLKMDIVGTEKEVLPDILKYSDQITGMIIAVNIERNLDIKKVYDLLDLINKDFILISRNTSHHRGIMKTKNFHSLYFKGELLNNKLYLGYINKNLVDEYKISLDQNTKNLYKNYKIINGKYLASSEFDEIIPPNKIKSIIAIRKTLNDSISKNQIIIKLKQKIKKLIIKIKQELN